MVMETENSSNCTYREPCNGGDRNAKKVRFKEGIDGETSNMVVNSGQQPVLSFKDKLLGGRVVPPDENLEGNLDNNKSDFELMDGDINTSMVNGIPAIAFSN